MTTPRDPDRLIHAFLDEGEEVLNDRVYDVVRAEIEQKRQRAVIGLWRTPTMNKFATVALGAVAVVVLLFVGAQFFGSPADGGVGSEPTPSATAEPTPEPTPSPSVEAGFPEGPHLLTSGQADRPEDEIPPLTVTIPAPGWFSDDGEGSGILLKDWETAAGGAGMTVFASQEYQVYRDPCNWESTVPDTPVTTVDEFVAALSSQASRNASEPVDITLGGYSGKSITLDVPDDADFSQCDQGTFGSWNCGGADAQIPCSFHSGPGETDTEYILDVDGVIVAWHTGYEAGTPADVVAELEAIVQSATFGE
jgi:hypothetical protein